MTIELFATEGEALAAAWRLRELPEGADMPALLYEAESGRTEIQQRLAAAGSELHVIMPHAPSSGDPPRFEGLALNRQTSGHRGGYTWSSLLLDDAADAVGYSTLSAPETRRYWSKLLPDTGAAVDLACTYVGATQLAKGYGRVRLLALAWR